MSGYNYYPIKVKKIKKSSPFLLKDILRMKDYNKNLYMKNLLQSHGRESIRRSFLTERNNSSSNNEYIDSININSTDRKYKNDFSNSNDLSIELNKRMHTDDNNCMPPIKKNFFNSISTMSLNDNKYNKNKLCKLSDYIIKPYKKKAIIMNPYKSNIKIKTIKMNLTTTPETNNNSNSYTERTFYKTRCSNDMGKDNFDIINLQNKFKDNRLNNNLYEKKENKIRLDGPLINLLYNNENNNNREKYNYNKWQKNNTTKQKAKTIRKIYLDIGTPKQFLTPSKTSYEQYKKKLSQVLLLLLEKYYKTYLLKFKYLFINNLKNYQKIIKQPKYKNKRNKETFNFCNYYPTEDKNETSKNLDKDNNLNSTFCNSRRDKILMYRLKDRNLSYSKDNFNKSELCRNKNELIKMEEIINRRKESQSKNRSKGKNKSLIKNHSKSPTKSKQQKDYIKPKKIIYRNQRTNLANLKKINQKKIMNKSGINFFKNNKKNENIQKNNNKDILNNKGKILIVKKICTKDQKINIDIKYIDSVNFWKKKKYTNLKISKDFSIDLIRQSLNKQIIIQKLGYKFYNNRNDEQLDLSNRYNLGLIKEEEEKSNAEDKYHSKY